MVLSSASREVNQESYLPEFLLQATFGAASPGGMSPMSPANARVRTWDVGLGVALENSPTKRAEMGEICNPKLGTARYSWSCWELLGGQISSTTTQRQRTLGGSELSHTLSQAPELAGRDSCGETNFPDLDCGYSGTMLKRL